ncbi:DNA-directed RNA polymerase I subunit RPA1 [Blomia tropicalis]|nr:DNA-directed RNA polymerase I subunit RPA1 [Blomia tropicalis]
MGTSTEQASCQITGVSFRLFSENESKRLSVLSITNPTTFDPLGHPIDTGLSDTALGPLKRNDFCKTCGLTDSNCLGHFGHVSLPLPVFNPFLMKQLFQILKMFCFNCHYFLFSRNHVEVYIAQLRALDLGLDFILDDILEYANEVTNSVKGFDWNSLEGQTYLRNKLNEKINTEFRQLKSTKLTNESFEDEPPSSLNDGISTLENVEIMNSKNVIEKKQQIFKDFFGGKLIKPTKICCNCNSRKAGMNVINRSLIILSSTKAAQSVANFDNDEDDEQDSSGKNIKVEMKGKSYLTPSQTREHLRRLWANERETLLRIFPFINFETDNSNNQTMENGFEVVNEKDSCPLDVFFWETIIVSPNRFRPLRMLNGRSFEHYRTSALAELMLVAKSLELTLENAKKSNSGDTIARFHSNWQRLQILCNRLYDSKMDRLPDNNSMGVKQILEKKEGLLRKNMMGKRVNFAARSVISPDPYIMVDEIGIPVIFATKLSYPQPVTVWNLKQLQNMVINGPNVHPGALSVTYEDGYTVRLKPDDVAQRRSVASSLHPPSRTSGLNGVKIVNRHLISGDVLLLNRQPTLHKPSIMAHKARVLHKEKTLRLHYANCKCYNADFDGDEMNAHFPQSELARAEAYGVASVNNQFLVPKDGSPLSGLIQDHIVSGVMFTIRGKFFNKSDYQELVYGALSFLDKKINFLPPTIIKPFQLWSGKQIISTLVLNLVPSGKPLPTFEIESKISAKLLTIQKPSEWRYGGTPLKEKDMCESQVIFRHGELLSGIMDKTNFGANKNGLIHCCYELYGGDVHTRLLTAIARVATNYLQCHHGFTLGIHDILVRSKPNAKRRKLIETAESLGHQAVVDAFDMKTALDNGTLTIDDIKDKLSSAHTSKDDFHMKQLDSAYQSYTDKLSNQISETCLPKGLVKLFPSNNLQMMIQAGAKGGSVNAIQISCLLGQIALEGRRIPLMMSGRTLPSFRPYETHPRAGGFVTGRFLTGIRPQEFFFHCMAGREGLIDTAVKTSRSGYLQRCLIKHLEGLVVNYDLTVRDSEGSVVQWMYGEDGLDVIRSQSLKKSFFPIILNNCKALKPTKSELSRLKASREVGIPKMMSSVRNSLERVKKNGNQGRTSPFFQFAQEFYENKINDQRIKCEEEVSYRFEPISKDQLVEVWQELDPKKQKSYRQHVPKAKDPVISRYRPDLNFGAISETLDSVIRNYVENEMKHVSISTKKTDHEIVKEFKNTLNACYMRALCAPGEAVGLLAAQSIGEPSTQMTLNTFHFAGRGEMNVTLGVPRLRELLMTASPNISTPSMDIPFRTDLPPNMDVQAEAEKCRLRLNAVRLRDVLEYVDVMEVLEVSDSNCHHRYRNYQIRFQFLPKSSYKRKYFTNPSKVLHHMENQFLRKLIEAISRHYRLLARSAGLFDTKSNVTRQRTSGAVAARRRAAAGEDVDEELMIQNDSGADDDLNQADRIRIEMSDDDDDDADDLDLEEGEGDTTATKHRTRLTQEREYEEKDQEEMEEDSDLEDQSPPNDADHLDETIKIKDEDEETSDTVIIPIKSKLAKKATINEDPDAEMNAANTERRTRVMNIGKGTIIDYQFDQEKQLWCEVTLRFELTPSKLDLRSIITEEASKAFIHRVGRLDRVFLVKDNEAAKRDAKFAYLIKTENVSLAHVVEYEQLLDLRRIYTNDMHAIARTYGIEAARAALIREITSVFAVYGISVDVRHLCLIADHMTFTGKIKGMNRGAMDGISPIQAMTFETTTNFLKNSLLLDLKDDLNSPSSRLVIGRPTLVGSGLFETRLNPSMLTGLQNPNIRYGTSVPHRTSIGLGTPSLSLSRTSLNASRLSMGSFLDKSTLLTPRIVSPMVKQESSDTEEAKGKKRSLKSFIDTQSTSTSNQSSIPVASIQNKRIKFEYDSD